MDEHLRTARADLARLVERGRAGELSALPALHRADRHAHADYRPAAVLLAFTPTTASPARFPAVDLFLVQRSPLLRHHPGQIALPGGRTDPGDDGPVGTALREAHEEIGLAPERVEVIGALPQVAVPVSRFLVTPVVGWAADAHGLETVEEGEVLHTLRVSVADLLAPEARATVTMHHFGTAGFAVDGGWVWGFTGNLLSAAFDELGWTRPWDAGRTYRMSVAEARGDDLPPATAEG